MWENALSKGTLVSRIDVPSVKGKLRQLSIDFGIVRWPKQLGLAWVFSLTVASLRIVFTIGLKRITKIIVVE